MHPHQPGGCRFRVRGYGDRLPQLGNGSLAAQGVPKDRQPLTRNDPVHRAEVQHEMLMRADQAAAFEPERITPELS